MNEGTERVFRASLEPGGAALGWTVAHVPFDPLSAWPQRVRLRVKGEMRGPKGSLAFRSSLFAGSVLTGGRQGFYLLINKRMLAASGTATGTEAEFRLLPDLEERPAELPEELDALLDEADGLRAWYGDLSEYTRREIGKWLGLANGVEARLRRAGQMAERLLSTMEAEAELPPELERGFRARPAARRGWASMTAAQRRNELFAVFYYQTPEARTKRIVKLLDMAERRKAEVAG